MKVDYDYLRTGAAIGFHASHELCSNYLFCNEFYCCVHVHLTCICSVNCLLP